MRLARTEEELFERSDAIYITVPNTLHAQAASRALQHGKHVFLEKPFATTLAEADSLRRAASGGKTILQVGHNRRFAPAYQAVKDCLKRGDIEPTLAHFKMNRGELESPAWVGNTSVTGGYLYETPLHLLDLARWFFGEVAEVRAHAARRVYSELDNFSFLLLFESGLSLTFTSCAHSTWAFPFERVEIFGRYLTIETAEMDRVSLSAGLNRPASRPGFQRSGPGRETGICRHRCELHRGGSRRRSSGSDGGGRLSFGRNCRSVLSREPPKRQSSIIVNRKSSID